jgi:integrase
MKVYSSLKGKYLLYCDNLGIEPWPLRNDILEEYMAWLIDSGRPGSLKGAWTALTYHNEMEFGRRMTKSRTIKTLERAADRVLAERGTKPRDAFLADMARSFCRKMKKGKRQDVMTAAVLTVGLRGLLRAGEIMGLKFKHVTSHLGYMTLSLEHRKNARSKVPLIFLDESPQSISCPVKCLKDWMKIRKREGARGDDYIFTTNAKKGTHLSYKIISGMVKKAGKEAGYEDLNLSGHSLRIGGATEAMLANFSELEIRIMGDWKSDSYMRYLRAVAPAAKGASARMGL